MIGRESWKSLSYCIGAYISNGAQKKREIKNFSFPPTHSAKKSGEAASQKICYASTDIDSDAVFGLCFFAALSAYDKALAKPFRKSMLEYFAWDKAKVCHAPWCQRRSKSLPRLPKGSVQQEMYSPWKKIFGENKG